MFKLKQADLDPSLAPTLIAARKKFIDRTAAAWICGPGAWDAFLPRMKAHTRHYAYLFAHRGPYFTLPAIDNSVLTFEGLVDLQNALVILRNAHQNPAPQDGPVTAGYNGSDATIILRPNAYIVLPQTRSFANLYVPMPDASAHELMSDPAELDREFPGIFKIVS